MLITFANFTQGPFFYRSEVVKKLHFSGTVFLHHICVYMLNIYFYSLEFFISYLLLFYCPPSASALNRFAVETEISEQEPKSELKFVLDTDSC